MKTLWIVSCPDKSIDREAEPERWEANRVDYATLIREVVRLPLNRQTGASLEEMRKGIRILDALDQLPSGRPTRLDLEDADWEHLCEKVRAFPWGTIDRRLLKFAESVLGAAAPPEGNGRDDAAAAGLVSTPRQSRAR